METLPAFPSNKRHAMHFRHHSPAHEFITARFPNPKVGNLSPSNVSISACHTPGTISEALSLATAPTPPPHHVKSVSQSRRPLPRSQSSSWWLEIRKSPTPKQEPRSRKADYATIVTEATETEPAFESDRFAVQMPTTRLPILDPPVFRAKLSSPSKEQVEEAYQTYKAKAQQVRETNHENGVRVPEEIVSYNYSNHPYAGYNQPLEGYISPPSSPCGFDAAGAFPISPPIPQHAWESPYKQQQERHDQHGRIQDPRSVSDSTAMNVSRKPAGLGSRSNKQSVYHRDDASSGASRAFTPSHTPSPEKQKIKVTLKHPTTMKSQDQRIPKEPWSASYQSSPQTSDGSRTRTPSPTKSGHSPAKLKFEYTNVPVVADPMFGYSSQDLSGTLAAVKAKEKEKSKDRVAETPKKKEASRWGWGWFRSTSPRVAKATPVAVPTRPMTYVDPFMQHVTPTPTPTSTPVASRPNSPRKIITHRPPPIPVSAPPKGEFDTGFAQVTSLTTLVVKICVIIYMLVGLYFILDAIRTAVLAIAAPFRAVKMVGAFLWLGVLWLGRWLGWVWQRGGIKIALEEGW
jgi:hypothetical protein